MIVQGLSQALEDTEARIAKNACFAIHNLAKAFDSEDQTSALSSTTPFLIEKLVAAGDRSDWQDCNLRVTAYEAINSLAENCANDMVPVMIQILVPVLGRLQSTLASQPTTTAEKENSDCLQTNLCSLLQVVVTRIVDDVKPSASNCMQCLLGVLAAKNSIAAGESMMAIGAIANALEAEFAMYVDALMPFIFTALQNFEEYEVCAVAVGLVGDVCRAVEGRIAPHCANIMTLLIQCLQSEDLHRSVKPPVLSVFGDVAMALNGDFEPYVQASMTMLQGAIQQSADDDADEEFLEYLNDL